MTDRFNCILDYPPQNFVDTLPTFGLKMTHQMETFSALLAICAGNSPITGEFPAQRPVTRSFGVFFDLRLNKRLSKQLRGWWFETPLRPLWRHSIVLEPVYSPDVQWPRHCPCC